MLNNRDMQLIAAVDKSRDLIVGMEKTLWGCPEVGFQEWKTTRVLREAYEQLGYTVFAPEDIPGFYVDIDTGRPGPKIMFCGELDALRNPNHPENVDGCVHSCGHHAQCCGVLGLAAGDAVNGQALGALEGDDRITGCRAVIAGSRGAHIAFIL